MAPGSEAGAVNVQVARTDVRAAAQESRVDGHAGERACEPYSSYGLRWHSLSGCHMP